MKIKNKKAISTIIAVTVAFSILVAFSATASAANWYVDDSGSNSNGGTSGVDAWRDISYAIGNASVSDGDTIMVDDGTYNESIVVDKELTIKAASIPILDGQGTLTNPAIHITSANVTVQGFIIQNYICTGTGTGGAGDIGAILVEGDGARVNNNVVWNITCTGEFPPCPCGLGIDVHANDVEITNNEVYNISSIGIRVRHDWNTPPATSNNVLIENNKVYWTGNSGVLITGYAKGVIIKGNEIYESLTSGTAYGVLLCMNPSYVSI
jgi:nitrous oxidase accessory protein NosD